MTMKPGQTKPGAGSAKPGSGPVKPGSKPGQTIKK